MKTREYILSKQIQWALNQGIRLIGSKGRRGRQTYVSYLNDNIFELLDIDILNSFSDGDGCELNGSANCPERMQAVHSSIA